MSLDYRHSTEHHISLLRACDPAWAFWQFPMERQIGTLNKFIRSHSRPHATLQEKLMRHCKADLIKYFGETYLPNEWAQSACKRPAPPGLPCGSLLVPQSTGLDCALLQPSSSHAEMDGTELAAMRAVLVQGSANLTPHVIMAKNYFRANSASGLVADSKPVGSDCDSHRRRNYLVRVNSTGTVFLPDRTVAVRPVSTFGAALQYAAVFIDGRPMAFAHVKRVKSAKDRRGRSGYASSTHGIQCFTGIGEVPYYVPIAAVREVVGSLESDGVHFILFSQEPFSEGQLICALELRSQYFHHLRVLVLSLASSFRYILCA